MAPRPKGQGAWLPSHAGLTASVALPRAGHFGAAWAVCLGSLVAPPAFGSFRVLGNLLAGRHPDICAEALMALPTEFPGQ